MKKNKPKPINFEAVQFESMNRWGWDGRIDNATIAYTRNDGHLIFDNGSGFIYASTNRHRNLLGSPESIRRAWCKLTGHTNKAVNDARKAWLVKQAKVRSSERVARVRREASQLGYRLVEDNRPVRNAF